MIGFILNGGPLAIVQVIFTILLLVVLTNVYFRFFSKKFEKLEKNLQTVKSLAVLILTLGVLGQVLGIYNALGAIVESTDISPKIVYQGFMISFNTTLFGLIVFVVTYINFIIIQLLHRKVN